MIKEIYKVRVKRTTLNVVQNKIESVKNSNITRSACRVYDGGYIGVASILGEPTEETWNEAISNLSMKIKAEYEPEKDKVRERVDKELNISNDNFIPTMEHMLNRVNEDYPNFSLSDSIILLETETVLTNDTGLDYKDIKRELQISLMAKYKDSEDLCDLMIGEIFKEYNEDDLFKSLDNLFGNFEKEVAMPQNKKIPIILMDCFMDGIIKETFNGEYVAKNASLLSDKVNKKVFNDNCSITYDRTASSFEPFFDGQGSTINNDTVKIVSNGVFERPLADKKVSKENGYECTAAADGNYDGIPSVERKWLNFECTSDSLEKLLGDRQAILVMLSMGGDCTSEGDMSMPAITSYLYKNGKLKGRLPRYSISGNIMNMFGKDYIGTVKDSSLNDTFRFVVFEGNINI